MEIVDYRIHDVEPRWLFTELETSAGLVGWGEHVTAGGADTIATAVERLIEGHLLGSDPLPIEDHWHHMYRGGFYRGGPVLMSAIAGIDQALWDLKGKHYGAPVHEIIGGKVRDRVRVYRWIGGDDPADVGEHARQRLEEGVTAMKMNATGRVRHVDSPAVIEHARARVAEVREAIGDEADVALDFHGRVTKPMAKRLAAAVDPYDPYFIEEPVLAEHNDALSTLAEHTSASIATGERMYGRWDFKPILESGAVDVVQPDLSHAGGITEVRKIATMAAAYDVALAPHCPLGPVAFAACLNVDAACWNAVIQEQSLDIHYHDDTDLLDYLVDPSVFALEDGHVAVPDGPGLGIELDPDAFRYRADRSTEDDGDRSAPPWYHPDGSLAEW